jgi:hypothetical protein
VWSKLDIVVVLVYAALFITTWAVMTGRVHP